MPSLTVKAAAEMLKLPAYAQARILTEQKYPKQGAQVFRTPYYRVALNGISAFFKNSRDLGELNKAKVRAESLMPESKRENNKRAIDLFQKSNLAKRKLELINNSKVFAELNTVNFRLSADFWALENGKDIILYVNCRSHVLDPDVARISLEIAHWVLDQKKIDIKLNQLEYYDLFSNTSYVFKKRRVTTIQALEENSKIIEALWPSL